MVSDDAISALKTSIRGEVLFPTHPKYDAERKIHNAMIDRRPAMIVCCTSTADVAASVKLARNTGMPVTVRGAGHNAAGISIADDALLIDLSHMKSVSINTPSGTATAGTRSDLGRTQ